MAILVLMGVLFVSLYAAVPAKASQTLTITDTTNSSSSSGYVGDTLTFSGSGYTYGDTVSIQVGGNEIASGTVGATGSFTANYVIDPAPGGDYEVDAVVGSTTVAYAMFTVLPQIVLTPTWGPSGTLVAVDGTGFAADSSVSGTFGSTDVITSVGTDDGGSFTTSFNVPSLSNGPYQVTVTDDYDNSITAHATFTISLVDPLPEYPIGALVAVLACFGTFVLYRKRKSIPNLIFHRTPF